MMRPLEYPKASSVKPLLQRMAEEKRFQMERGSIGGSYFMVQLPDGSMEKRMKMPINIDPGVHSSFNLDQLVPGKGLWPSNLICSNDCKREVSRKHREVESIVLFILVTLSGIRKKSTLLKRSKNILFDLKIYELLKIVF